MKPKTKQLLQKLENNHDWLHEGTRGYVGTAYSSRRICRVCGLQWHWFSDTQNGIEDRITFSTMLDEPLSLAEAAELKCC